MIPVVETPRLVMRGFSEGDLDAWAAIRADPIVAEHVGGVMDRASSWSRMAEYIGHWALRGYGQWAVVERSSGELVGRCGLWFPEGWPELEVGWTLAHSVWGRGYATEAGAASIEWGRSTLGLTRIASVISPGNERSIAVAERLGMTFDRTTKLADDEVVDVYAKSL